MRSWLVALSILFVQMGCGAGTIKDDRQDSGDLADGSVIADAAPDATLSADAQSRQSY